MDAKDLRTVSGVSERDHDGTKYAPIGGSALHCDRNKTYQDIGSTTTVKVDGANSRPCAIIGPDRVVPPPSASDAYLRKAPPEPWACMDNAYRRPPDYPHNLHDFQNPTRNISPRQTFQENMQRIMVPPTYSSIKTNIDSAGTQVPENSAHPKNIKLNMPPEAKFCDVPYTVNPTSNEQKSMCLSSVNPTITRTAPYGWPPASVNLRPTKAYGAPELYQYAEYPSCAGPQPVVPRTQRPGVEEPSYMYPDPYYQDGSIRYKPYPTNMKERYPQQRYDYIGNYSSPFHPPPNFPPHKYDVQKSMPSHPYPPYPPIKYLDSRINEPVFDGYQRNPQGNYSMPYRNHIIHPNYGPIVGTSAPNKMHSYPPDTHVKNIALNKLPYENNPKAYLEYENSRHKMYPPTESYFINEMTRMQPMKSQVIMPNYSALNVHNMPPQYYKKDSHQMKNIEYMTHYRNIDPTMNIHNHISRQPSLFSTNTLAISPTDSNTSNDNTQSFVASQEDCGYVSQSSTASVRSIDSGINRLPNDYLRRYHESRHGHPVRAPHIIPNKTDLHSHTNSKEKKNNINVRQFLEMWNEGEDESEDKNSKDFTIQTGFSGKPLSGKAHEALNNQEQLYVLGLEYVSSEELAKYEHIQKVSKLPENIKGYNNIELLTQFEEAIESSNINNYKAPTPKDYQKPLKSMPSNVVGVLPSRPVSPLDVEAKISQSVIHKEVGCNFEIKPCSPKMLNVEIAAPVQNILAERSIEKVVNPIMRKSPLVNTMDDKIDCKINKRHDHRMDVTENERNPSCKLNKQFPNNAIDTVKSTYSFQDLESNSGLCLASLPRLDNDIELNFPEVNQQFINANKNDSCVTSSPHNLPLLEEPDLPDNRAINKCININSPKQETDVNPPKSPYLHDTEKEFSKLSKYRKSKTNLPDVKENLVQCNTFRTDSVIIKNPENAKNHEESTNFVNSINESIKDSPINLTSHGNITENNILEFDSSNLPIDTNEPVSSDSAIDFSLNKSGKLEMTNLTIINADLIPVSNEDKSSDRYKQIYSTNHDTTNNSQDVVMELDDMETKSGIIQNTRYRKENNLDCEGPNDDANSAITSMAVTSPVDENSPGTPESDQKLQFDEPFKDCVPQHTSSILIDDSRKKLDDNTNERSPIQSPCMMSNLKSDLVDSYENECVMKSDEQDGTFMSVSGRRTEKFVESRNFDQEISFRSNNNINNITVMDKSVQLQNTSENNEKETEINSYDVAGIDKKSNTANEEVFYSVQSPNLNMSNESIVLKLEHDNTTDKTQQINKEVDNINHASNNKQIIDKESISLTNHPIVSEFNAHLKLLESSSSYDECQQDSENIRFGHFPRKLFPMSKEMYSPWVQNLIIFSEGSISNMENINNLSDTQAIKQSNVDSTSLQYSSPNSKTVIDESETQNEENVNSLSNELFHNCETGSVSLDTSNENIEVGSCNIYIYSTKKERLTTPIVESPVKHIKDEPLYKENNDNLCLGNDQPSKLNSIDMDVDINYDHQNCLETKEPNYNKTREAHSVSKKEISDSYNDDNVETNLVNLNTGNEDLNLNLGNKQCLHIESVKDALFDKEENYDSYNILISKMDSNINETKDNNQKFEQKEKNNNNELRDGPLYTEEFDGTGNHDETSGPIPSNKIKQDHQMSLQREELTSKELREESQCAEKILSNKLGSEMTSNIIVEDISGDNHKITCDPEQTKSSNSTDNIKERTSFTIKNMERCGEYIQNQSPTTSSSDRYTYKDDFGRLNNSYSDFENKSDQNCVDVNKDLIENQYINKEESHKLDCSIKPFNKEKIDNSCKSPIKEHNNNPKFISNVLNNSIEVLNKDDVLHNNNLTNDKLEYTSVFQQNNNSHDEPDQSNITYDTNSEANNEKSILSWREEVLTNTINRNSEELDSKTDLNDYLDEQNRQIWLPKNQCVEGEHCEEGTTELSVKYSDLNFSEAEDQCTKTEIKECIQYEPVHENDLCQGINNTIATIVETPVDQFEHETIFEDEHYSGKADQVIQNWSEKIFHKTDAAQYILETQESGRNCDSDNKIHTVKRECTKSLKRSLSDSALNTFSNTNNLKRHNEENNQYTWPFKRRKVNNDENEILAQNICNLIQNNRRNSISSFYTEDDVSFCILIDNSCIITEEENGDQDKMCFTELTEECLTEIHNNEDCGENVETEFTHITNPEKDSSSGSCSLEYEEEKSMEESWVEDVACVETVMSDDIAENIEINQTQSPFNDCDSDNDESEVFSSSDHTDKVKYIYGDKMCNDDAHLVETLFNTPQMDVNKTLNLKELPQSPDPSVPEVCEKYYDSDSLEKMLSESNESYNVTPYVPKCMDPLLTAGVSDYNDIPESKENVISKSVSPYQFEDVRHDSFKMDLDLCTEEGLRSEHYPNDTQHDKVYTCETSLDNVFSYKQKDESMSYTTSSSPEVSSTTSEEKNSAILLKITNYQGSRISQITDISKVSKRSSCKFTEEKDYLQSHTNFPKSRPLLTKAAQKYIPPIKETIRELKVKLTLPQQSLMKLKQLKLSKDEPKLNKKTISISTIIKKPKPKFEDVLKSIDEIQFKKHKEKSKRTKKSIPKVVIKKNENGSHYASTSNKHEFNPDLTGRKWQPWVFIEKNHFIDKMAIKNKTHAVYSYRKKSYVLAEKFHKYKSVNHAKFVISPPMFASPSSGLKYTIRLKHC